MIQNNFKNNEELFKECKLNCGITWDDTDTDKLIKDAINEGIDVLQNDVGTSIDFDEDSEARSLLKTYVRYAWNHSEEYFIENNLSRMLKLEARYGN